MVVASPPHQLGLSFRRMNLRPFRGLRGLCVTNGTARLCPWALFWSFTRCRRGNVHFVKIKGIKTSLASQAQRTAFAPLPLKNFRDCFCFSIKYSIFFQPAVPTCTQSLPAPRRARFGTHLCSSCSSPTQLQEKRICSVQRSLMPCSL